MSTYDDVIREQFADYEKEGRNVFFMRKDLKKDKKTLKNRSDLDNSKFLATDLTEANLSNSNLYNSIFDFTTLIGANLSKANLEGSTFLKGTNLNDANLKGAILKDAVFKHAHVDGADFEGAVLDGVFFDPEHVYNLDRANFKKTIFEGRPGYGNNYTGKSIEKEKEDKRKEERREKRETKKIENAKMNTVFTEPVTNTSKYIYKTHMDEIKEYTKLDREEEEKKRKEEERINQFIEENKRSAPVKTMNTNYQAYPQDIIAELFEQMKEEEKNKTGKGGKKRKTKKNKKTEKRKSKRNRNSKRRV